MRASVFSVVVSLIAALALCGCGKGDSSKAAGSSPGSAAAAPSSPAASVAAATVSGKPDASQIPSHIDATMQAVLAKARATWRPDAIVTSIEMKWYPGDQPDAANVTHWLEIMLNSPSDGARRYLYVGGPYDGNSVDNMPPDPDGSTVDHAIPDFKFDLPQAMSFIRKVGLKERLFFVKLVTVGAANTRPLAAWTIASLSDSALFPLALDAQTGAIIPWTRAYNPPPFTDAQMRAAWNQVLHPGPPPGTNNAQQHLECFMSVQEFGYCVN